MLQGKLQSGGTLPKWEDRSRVGVYLGRSRQHATNVSLILNPKTGFVSPQFHCIFDDKFDSIKHDKNFSSVWAEKAGLMLQQQEQDDDDCSKTQMLEQLFIPFEGEGQVAQSQDDRDTTQTTEAEGATEELSSAQEDESPAAEQV